MDPTLEAGAPASTIHRKRAPPPGCTLQRDKRRAKTDPTGTGPHQARARPIKIFCTSDVPS